MQKKNNHSNDSYKEIAPYYDAVTAKALLKPRKYIAELCALYNFTRVLDVGCGTGELVSLLNNKKIAAHGLDSSQHMLKYAYKKYPFTQNNTSTNNPLIAPPVTTQATTQMHIQKTPQKKLQNVFIHGNALDLLTVPQEFDALIYALILHETDENAKAILEHGFAKSPHIIVLEWHAPERNLDFLCTFWAHAIERLAGKKHYANYRAFIRTAGIFGLAHQTGAKIIESKRFLGGSMICALLQKQ